MTKISSILTNDVDLKLKKLKQSKDYFLKMSNVWQKELKVLSDLYSFWLEFPESRRDLIGGNNKREILKKARKGYDNIRSAWQILSTHEKSLAEEFDQDLLLNVGRNVDPENKAYRNARVSLNLKTYTPPNHIKIPNLVESLKKTLMNSSLDRTHPLETAIYMHLKLVGIQPFFDGNKRVARLFQDRVLYENGLPPAIIHPGEREAYVGLLENALAGDQDEDTKKQREFFDYVGGKVNSALDDILKDLKLPLKYKLK